MFILIFFFIDRIFPLSRYCMGAFAGGGKRSLNDLDDSPSDEKSNNLHLVPENKK